MSNEITPGVALERLKKGNERFVGGLAQARYSGTPPEFGALVDGQSPFATILGCSDSRVPTELIFDQGLGDLFVTRVAGNIAAPSQIGSVEYATAVLGTPLVVVLGHTGCGAVQATIDAIRSDDPGLSDNLLAIVDRVAPAIDTMVSTHSEDEHALLNKAVRANVRATIEQLESESELIQGLLSKGSLEIIGAEYDLATGKVRFFE